jgi:peptide/nickel transport system substrate-binding protein
MKRRRTGLIAIGLALLAGAGCDVSDLPQAPRTLTVAVPRDLSTLDPAATLIQNNFSVVDLAYQRLLRFELRDGRPTGRLIGELASSVEPSPDGKLWTARIEPGHRFDDGTEVTAEAVKFSFDRVQRMRLGPSQALSWLKRTEVTGPYEVRFVLATPVPFFAQILAMPAAAVVNPRLLVHEVDGDLGLRWLSSNTAGSGPYRLVANALGERVVLAPNPHARQPPRYFDRIVFRTVRDETERLIQLGNGDLDIVDGISADQAGWIASRPGITTLSAPTASVLFLQLNNDRKPFTDRRVREAISLAIDREALRRHLDDAGSVALRGFVPEGVPGFDAGLPLASFDPVQARRLLREAGVPEGAKMTLTYVSDRTTPSPLLLGILAQLENVGLRVSIRQVSAGSRQEIFSGEFEITLQQISLDFPDPWILFTFVYDSRMIGSIGNVSRYRSAELDALLRRADGVTGEARAALYREAQRIVLRDTPNVPLWQSGWILAHRADLRGLDYNFSIPYIYNAEDMWRVEAPVTSRPGT